MTRNELESIKRSETAGRFRPLGHRSAYCQVPGCNCRAEYIRTIMVPNWYSVMHLCGTHSVEGGMP